MTQSKALETITTPTGRVLRVRTRTVGCRFATIGQLVARNGRVVAETRQLPYGFDAVAKQAAIQIAKAL